LVIWETAGEISLKLNIRLVVTVVMSVAFMVLLVSGVLLYSTEYGYFTASLHVWASILVIIGVGWHLKNNWKAYTRHLSIKQGKLAFILVLLGVAPVSYGIIVDLAPFVSVIKFGQNLRSAGSVREGDFSLVDLSGGQSGGLSVFVKAGQYYQSEPQPLFLGFSYTATPQIAIWIEDQQGNFVKTLYITNKLSNSSFRPKPGEPEVIRRPEALPYWGHRSAGPSKDGLYVPEVGSTRYDGFTAATPKSDHLLLLPKQTAAKYKVLMEVNRTYDFNTYYSKDRYPQDPVYSGSGSSGQPSLIYAADIDTSVTGEALFSLIGHGHYSGQNGDLFTDLDNISTAKSIIAFGVVQQL
jgi:hypothetical protein